MNLLLLLELAVPLSCLAFLSLLALLDVATLGAVIHVLGPQTIRAFPIRGGIPQAVPDFPDRPRRGQSALRCAAAARPAARAPRAATRLLRCQPETSISTALWLASTEPTSHKYVRSASNGENNNRGRKGNQGETRDEEVHPHRSARSGARYSGLGFCPAIPQQAGQDHRAVPARWRHRHRRTAGGAETVGETWRTVLHREHRRRWRQSRHGPSRAFSGRWLHHPVRLFEHRGEPYAL